VLLEDLASRGGGGDEAAELALDEGLVDGKGTGLFQFLDRISPDPELAEAVFRGSSSTALPV